MNCIVIYITLHLVAIQIVLLVFYRHKTLKGKHFKAKKGSNGFDSNAR